MNNFPFQNEAALELSRTAENDKYINVLLLGETGVGKSTFINSVANYLHFTDLKEAQSHGPKIVIPTSFTLSDKTGKTRNITIGSCDDECQDIGASATQRVKTYVFPIKNADKTFMRFVDSPGMGDTRGIEKDEEHCEEIIKYIAELRELHGICFLMKPTNTRITALFEYCIKQIFSRLEKSASRNVIFAFTNTRGSDYTAGETLPCLKKLMEDIKAQPPHVEIPVKKNIFCFDNEGFRWLVAKMEGVEFNKTIRKKHCESWKHSSKECGKMVSYLLGGKKNEPIAPHVVSESVRVNEARKMIALLAKPLSDISEQISQNSYSLQRQRENLAMEEQNRNVLNAKLYSSVPSVRRNNSGITQTVCTGISCTEILKVNGVETRHLRTSCHFPCNCPATTVAPEEVVGVPALRSCAIMNLEGKCNNCICDYRLHMRICYQTEKFMASVVDESVKNDIVVKNITIAKIKHAIENVNQSRKELQREREAVWKCTAKFAHFLKNNTITSFNDTLKEYITQLIIQEKSRGEEADKTKLLNLETKLKQYEEQKTVFDNLLATDEDGDSLSEAMLDSISSLFILKHNGCGIRQLFDKKRRSKDVQFEDSCEHVRSELEGISLSETRNGELISDDTDEDVYESCEEGAEAPWEGEFKGLKIQEDKFVNILLLGETGVGKSTFINSIANYFHSRGFEEAVTREILVIIPSQITVTDKNGEYHSMHIGSDQNEYQEIGASATQNVKTYVFPIGEGRTKLRLIDCPGMGDTRGVTKDDQNCDNILTYISQLEELHAICFLMRPTNTRITVLFEYCVKQILSRLEKSASDNIIFIFTNTSGVDYSPGETLPCLKKVVDKIRSKPPFVNIPVKDNIFCLDNEAFRCLAAMRNCVEFSETVVEKCVLSWDFSARECWRMVSYIVGYDLREPLKPHKMSNSVSVNEARRMIIHLSKPLADISQLISDNLRVLQTHEDNLKKDNQTLVELTRQLYLPVVNLQLIELSQPVTVCTSERCAEVYQIHGLRKWHYRQRCHNPCYLQNVPKEIVGDPALTECTAMGGTLSCLRCRCAYTIHMHIYYETQTVDGTAVDDSVNVRIKSKKKALEEVQKLIRNMNQKKAELQNEYDIIVRSTAQFAHFLQNNAITPFNDSYKDYIQHLITREKGLGDAADLNSIKEFEKMLKQYEQEKATFDRCLQMDKLSGTQTVTARTVLNSITVLFGLKHNGSMIKQIYEKQKLVRDAHYVGNCEYVHPEVTSVPGRIMNYVKKFTSIFSLSKKPKKSRKSRNKK